MIEKLILDDFRNYSEKSLEFEEKKIVFFGGNGRGKTNILEAISILSVGKSWRETAAVDLLRDDAESAQIRSVVHNGDQFRVQIQPRSRTFFRNDKKIPRHKFFGQIPSLLFAPEHLSLFSGAKRERQKFFDRFLAQLWPTYRENLARADRAVRQKNALFREVWKDNSGISEPGFENAIRPWNEILAESIPEVWRLRTKFLASLAEPLQTQLSEISAASDPVAVSLVSPEHFDPSPDGVRAFFSQNFARESAAKKCLLGPHRDDFLFSLRERSLITTASRGEERSVLLALLAAQKNILSDFSGQVPVLLLDDCFSELDDDRQAALQKLCVGTQAFFTTTHEEHFARFDGDVQKIKI
ncbi:DNA replication and repair protein RecF [bacterium]|jgi:DNA replication and repair protein RecF|nr:DNA replication and repair protein RecF [bacterium]MBT6831701.1 DNA replication and repair protein RecF [bacterium]MBT6996681.1 DNA replication and repair protein RecF [bacterium]MBT7772850.1 DNA replication and repair protein RecF [bacterium]